MSGLGLAPDGKPLPTPLPCAPGDTIYVAGLTGCARICVAVTESGHVLHTTPGHYRNMTGEVIGKPPKRVQVAAAADVRKKRKAISGQFDRDGCTGDYIFTEDCLHITADIRTNKVPAFITILKQEYKNFLNQ